MKRTLKHLCRNWISAVISPRQLMGCSYLPRFIRDWMRYSINKKGEERVKFIDTYPCLTDWVTHTPFDPHYFYQGAWLARKLALSKPVKHVDIGSSVLMLSVLSATVEVTFVDFRPLKTNLPGLSSMAGDITALNFGDDSIDSLSCLHVIEHIGLGRYGDPLDPQGGEKAMSELQRILRPGGHLYISLPIGKERVCFNAHRIYGADHVISYFNHLQLMEFSLVDDDGKFHDNVAPSLWNNLNYGCGMFHFRKATI